MTEPLSGAIRRMRACVEAWPECEEGKYDPRCCRFPKSCSCTVYDADLVDESRLEPVEPHGERADRAPKVAALFVNPQGTYAGREDVELWDEERDARLYMGPWPVVAHPPCNRFCRFAKQIEKVHGYKVGDDGGCFYSALDSVRAYGGVIEHPAGSLAWDIYGLPKPKSAGGWTVSLLDGGASCYVEQGRYGHPMRKATWLYAYGVELPELRWGRTNDQEILGAFKWGSRLYKPAHDRDRPRLQAREHAETPAAFRDALLDMARSAAVVALPSGEKKPQ